MRVLHVIDSLAQGGAEASLVELAPFLVERGVELEVAVLFDRPGMEAQLEEVGVPVHRSVAGGRVRRAVALRGLVRDRSPELVHTTLYEANQAGRVAAAACRVPSVSSMVSTPYGPEQLDEPGLARTRVRLAQALDMATARLPRRWHANAEHVARTMSVRLRVPLDRFEVIPRGRDPERLGRRTVDRRGAARQTLDLAPDVPAVLAVARHEHAKGLDVLVRAMDLVRARHRRARLLVAGREGNATLALREAIDRAGLADTVSLLGDRGDVADLMAAADALAIPSRREGFPGVVVEGMALEVPIVASDLPGVREALGPGNGLLVPPDDPTALAAGIEAVLAEPGEAERRAATARERFVANFTTGTVADRMVAFYRRAVSR